MKKIDMESFKKIDEYKIENKKNKIKIYHL